jgi:hypothetical protein
VKNRVLSIRRTDINKSRIRLGMDFSEGMAAVKISDNGVMWTKNGELV